jgi:hypothetical protein
VGDWKAVGGSVLAGSTFNGSKPQSDGTSGTGLGHFKLQHTPS